MRNKEKIVKIEKFEDTMAWFESVYKGKPVEIDFMDQFKNYRGTLLYFKKDIKNVSKESN